MTYSMKLKGRFMIKNYAFDRTRGEEGGRDRHRTDRVNELDKEQRAIDAMHAHNDAIAFDHSTIRYDE